MKGVTENHPTSKKKFTQYLPRVSTTSKEQPFPIKRSLYTQRVSLATRFILPHQKKMKSDQRCFSFLRMTPHVPFFEKIDRFFFGLDIMKRSRIQNSFP